MANLSDAEWESLLYLMAAVVVADRNVLDNEVDVFCESLQALCHNAGLEGCLDRTELIRWIGDNAVEVRYAVQPDIDDLWVGRKLSALATSSQSATLYDALERLALADRHLAPRENDVIALASAILGRMPSAEFMARKAGSAA